MYELSDNFKFDMTNALSNPECVFKGNKYRITILTERLIRLEYSPYGIFNDNLTELVVNRKFDKPKFEVNENEGLLIITTKYFELLYQKETNFNGGKVSPTKNLKITLKETMKEWYYDHPEARNYRLNESDLSGKKKDKSLYSLDGFVSIDDSYNKILLEDGTFKNKENSSIDMYVFMYNKDFYYCLSDYFKLTGNPPMLPRYALGNWWAKDEIYNEKNIDTLIKKFENNDIPISIILLNKWQQNNDYDFDSNYQNPDGVLKYLNDKNIKVGLKLDECSEFKNGSKSFDKLKQYIEVNKDSIPFNLYDSKTLDAYLKLLIHPLNSRGVNFFSLNYYQEKNLDNQRILRHYLFHDNFKGENVRNIIDSYNPGVASHRYPVLYSGETSVSWDTLKNLVNFSIDSSNLGISYFSHDLGGFKDGIEDNELYTRFIQLGVFQPILRLGSSGGKYYKREPWSWGVKTLTIATKFLQLRYQLIPYIYTECYKYHKYGKPLIEPIYYRNSEMYDDVNYRNEYFFGGSMFVSPIITKKDYIMNRVIHKIYIPEGIWFDYFTGKKYTGNKKYVSFYKEEEYPVFVKAGAIIPISLNEFNDTNAPSKMEIQIFPGDSNTYSIFEDDGVTNNYLQGEYLITNIEFLYKKDNYSLTILPVEGRSDVVMQYRDYKVRFKNTKDTAEIITYTGSIEVGNKCYRDGNDLIVEVNKVPTDTQFTLICKGEDIAIDTIRIINEDISSIISDLPIKTAVKERTDQVMFADLPLNKKRIEVRKLSRGKNKLERKYIELFLKLLEYINEV